MVKFSEMSYARPDTDKVIEDIVRLTKEFESADNYETAKGLFVEADNLFRRLWTQATLVNIRHSIDTRDPFYDKEEDFWNETAPVLQEYTNAWTKAVYESKFREELKEEYGDVIFKNAELELKSFDPSIIPLLQEESKLVTEYEKLIASAKISFRGGTYTIAQMGPFKNDPDDATRLDAWKTEGRWYIDNQKKLDEIYDRLVRIRHEMSQKLGLEDYVELGYYRMTRNCYDRNDVAKFRSGVQRYIVPLADAIRRKQAERLGVEYPMSFSDATLMFRSGNPKPQGSSDDIIAAGKRFYDWLSPETSEFFNTMIDYELMDLLAKEGKQGGGYCTSIYDYRVPFIFANFNGTDDDVETVTHEAGHAFAAWCNRDRVPMEVIWPSLEACEVHSMSMEFFAWHSAEDFFGDDAHKFRYSHLAESFMFIPYGTMVDHFQHSVFENPEWMPAERHAEWKRLLGIYMPWLRLDGDIPFYSEGMGWQRQSHIYARPFYYIDYCLAQSVALGFWAMIQKDYKDAWDHYMRYTEQGGSRVFTELLSNAGLESPFDEEYIKKICALATDYIENYDLSNIK